MGTEGRSQQKESEVASVPSVTPNGAKCQEVLATPLAINAESAERELSMSVILPDGPAAVTSDATERSYDYISGAIRPTWRGRIHAFAAAASAIAGGILTVLSSGVALIASAVYGLSMLICFGVSASYHIIAKTRKSQLFMQRMDHAAINVLIAGTATPIYLVGVDPSWGIPMLVLTWSGAITGLVLKARHKAWRIASGLYILTGWVAVAALPALWSFAGPLPASMILAGGAVYTFGAVCFWKNWPKLNPEKFGYHEFWHVCTVIGGLLHFIAIALLIAR